MTQLLRRLQGWSLAAGLAAALTLTLWLAMAPSASKTGARGVPFAASAATVPVAASAATITITTTTTATAAATGVTRITSARFIKTSELEAPPEADPRWRTVHLPDNWQVSNPGQSGHGWYEVRFDVQALPQQPWSVYLPSVSTTYQLFINGSETGGTGGSDNEFPRTMGTPQIDPVAPQLLKAGSNRLTLRLRVATNLRGGLGPVSIGPRAQVEPIYDDDQFQRVTLPRSLNIALIFAGMLVFLLWLRRPAESIYGYFAALAVLWSIRNFHYTTSFAVIPTRLWEAFILGSLGLVVVLLLLFMMRFTGRRHVALERCAITVSLLAPLFFAALGENLASQLRTTWYLLCAGMGVAAIVVLLVYLFSPRGRGHRAAWVILAAMCTTLFLGLSDLAVSLQWLPWGPAARMAFGAPVLLTALTYAMADSYFRTFDEVRLLNSELERRVDERTEELGHTHERLRALEREAVIVDERDRLMRDLHDGVGSQLINTLHSLERGQLDATRAALLLRECIDDLRLVIDSMDTEERTLQATLANLRYRLEPRLSATGITLDWQVADTPVQLTPDALLQILRIVQEAFANALKHAGATQIRVSVGLREGAGLRVEIADNGAGFKPQARSPQHGRGLFNMSQRALRLSGVLNVDSSADGTLVRLDLPAATTV
ncbi:MAG: ATP-binding protein [Bdellovibrionales bacterium]|nr:ATP-binding protein [Ramlibacter sp.]